MSINSSSYYPFLPKNSSLESFKTTTTASISTLVYGDIITGSYPLTSSISTKYYASTTGSDCLDKNRKYICALKNTLNSYSYFSNHYLFSSSFGDKSTQEINLINVPSIFYGSSIDKGSVELGFYISGTLLAKLQDKNKNGELIETTGSNTGSVAGIVMYNEGIILLTGSWNLHNSFEETYIYTPTSSLAKPKWIYWGAGIDQGTNNLTLSSSFTLDFDGINYIPSLTMLAHAEKGDINHSNNPTYIKYGEFSNKQPLTSRHGYHEYTKLEIKNTVKYAYENFSGSLEKQTYISKIGIYDEKRNLIAIAKVAKPVRKPENRDLTFKLKLDI